MYYNWFTNDIWSQPSMVIALVSVLAAALYYYLQNKNLPPGPVGLPYLGLWPFLHNKTSHLQLDAFKKKYGNIFSFTSTGRLYINMGTTKAIREAHITNGDCFASRPQGFSVFSLMFEDGLAFVGGEQWKALRKFFMTVMRERGMGALKDSMSGPFYDCINTTIDQIKAKNKDEIIPIVRILSEKCNTIMRLTLFGEVGASDEEIKEINAYYEVMVGCMIGPNQLSNGTFARYFILPFTREYKDAKGSHKLIEAAIYKLINEHKSTYNQDNNRDIIDDYFSERNIMESKGDPTAKCLTDRALMATLTQLIGDGVLAVASFISMFIKVLLDHPEEQDKIYKELMEVIGPNRQPTIEDKSNLPYTNAFLLEALRVTDFFPYMPTRECTKETTMNGYKIPKGAITLMNIYSAHKDPEMYENPEKFDPLRFITTGGKRRPDLPIAFGGGKRSCIGEGFAMTQVFTFIASLLKNFRFSLPEGTTESTFELLFTGKLDVTVTHRN